MLQYTLNGNKIQANSLVTPGDAYCHEAEGIRLSAQRLSPWADSQATSPGLDIGPHDPSPCQHPAGDLGGPTAAEQRVRDTVSVAEP